METNNKVSHICLIDENENIYFEENPSLKWLSFIWWKLELEESFLDWAFRELNEETNQFFNFLPKSVLELIEENSDEVRWILWKWTLYWLKISSNQWDLLLNNAKNIKKVAREALENTSFAPDLDKEQIITRTLKTINKLINTNES